MFEQTQSFPAQALSAAQVQAVSGGVSIYVDGIYWGEGVFDPRPWPSGIPISKVWPDGTKTPYF